MRTMGTASALLEQGKLRQNTDAKVIAGQSDLSGDAK